MWAEGDCRCLLGTGGAWWIELAVFFCFQPPDFFLSVRT